MDYLPVLGIGTGKVHRGHVKGGEGTDGIEDKLHMYRLADGARRGGRQAWSALCDRLSPTLLEVVREFADDPDERIRLVEIAKIGVLRAIRRWPSESPFGFRVPSLLSCVRSEARHELMRTLQKGCYAPETVLQCATRSSNSRREESSPLPRDQSTSQENPSVRKARMGISVQVHDRLHGALNDRDSHASSSTDCDGMALGSVIDLAKGGNQRARAELCLRFSPLVAKLVSGRPSSEDDLEQEARIAILRAIDEYNPAKGTFAWLVEKRIRDALRRVAKSEPRPALEYSEDADDDDEGGHANVSVAAEINAMTHRWYLEDDPDLVSGSWAGASRILSAAMSETLSLEDQIMLGRLFGIAGHSKCTQAQLAAESGITQQAVSKRVEKAVKALEGANWYGIWRRRVEEEGWL